MRSAIARRRLRAAERERSLKTQYRQTATSDGCRSALERVEAVSADTAEKEAASDRSGTRTWENYTRSSVLAS